MGPAEQRLTEAGIVVPTPFRPVGRYVPARRWGDLVYVSGQGPVEPDGSGLVTGKVGTDVDLEEARRAARLTGLQLLGVLREELGTLDDVAAVLKVFGMVSTAPGFTDPPAVIDGCSELLLEVFGPEVGAHARSAIGVAELPRGIAVEIELVCATAAGAGRSDAARGAAPT
ncbi:enamine deaminase RidA (YjgF/YER057c/UK114 family) [Actinomycetospora succinea]|uniref:Enamine deaminase RidA (YjgF/YER057c/UK114 family) n=1 Tax=Actinomycetospora succinea TaxID=663603 RepID=A0A4V3DA69_9PSEU|nr:RidA family protein [Actinomycetospora succinea]TDQ60718.1 enamine deaminase RidA (YjgF/YER057c/UK114 family) [Actinomycetospora succinea]